MVAVSRMSGLPEIPGCCPQLREISIRKPGKELDRASSLFLGSWLPDQILRVRPSVTSPKWQGGRTEVQQARHWERRRPACILRCSAANGSVGKSRQEDPWERRRPAGVFVFVCGAADPTIDSRRTLRRCRRDACAPSEEEDAGGTPALPVGLLAALSRRFSSYRAAV